MVGGGSQAKLVGSGSATAMGMLAGQAWVVEASGLGVVGSGYVGAGLRPG